MALGTGNFQAVPFPRNAFSKTVGFRTRRQITDPAELPDSARARLIRFIDDKRGREFSGAYSLEPALREAVGMLTAGSGDIQGIRNLINNVEWSGYYDLCDELVRQSRRSPQRVIAELSTALLLGSFLANSLVLFDAIFFFSFEGVQRARKSSCYI